MIKRRIGVAAAVAATTVVGIVGSTPAGVNSATTSPRAATWSYSGPTGPAYWGSLDPSYLTCVDGSAQSPINIVAPKHARLKKLKFAYSPGEAGIFNNGHTVEAEPLGSSSDGVVINHMKYSFAQFHFHAPSEHKVNGKHYPVEIHFVNKTADGKLAVITVFAKVGAVNKAWKPFTSKMLSATADPEATKVTLDLAKLLPKTRTTYRYKGSLTTPGCTEGVKWNIFTTPITMSKKQIDTFRSAYEGNNRPVQPLHRRPVHTDLSMTK